MDGISPQTLSAIVGVGLILIGLLYRTNIIDKALRFRQERREEALLLGNTPEFKTGSPNAGDYLLFWGMLVGGMVFLGVAIFC